MIRAAIVIAAALLAGACGELPQDGPKPFVPAAERSNAAPLAQRAATQDENQAIRKQR